MTLSNAERVARCQAAIADYSDDDDRTNFVDFLADALHWCQANECSFREAMYVATIHFCAETNNEEMLDDHGRLQFGRRRT